MSSHLDVVFLDVGGPLYDEGPYFHSIRNALREMGADFTDEAYAAEYERCRDAQDGSFRKRLALAFLGPEADVAELTARAAEHWRYSSASLQPDVLPCLDLLSERYRLGVIGNQLATVREAMRRDGIDRYFEVWAVSDELGVEKPDPAIYEYALERAGAPPERTVMAGDRLDYDVRPAARVGMHTVWVLRGEAPSRPTPDQLAEPDAAVSSLTELPAALDGIGASSDGGPR
jgi:HAD superfamily hydrolase (TIGR01509 family)